MLALARQRTDDDRRVCWHHADARAWVPPDEAAYDLIVTHFFLDCFCDEELAPMVARFATGEKACRWVVSEFRQPTRGWQAWRARLWIGGLYRLFRWTTGLRVLRLPDYGGALEKNGFRRVKAVVAQRGLLTSELWERP